MEPICLNNCFVDSILVQTYRSREDFSQLQDCSLFFLILGGFSMKLISLSKCFVDPRPI
jgi:hypothetical protein